MSYKKEENGKFVNGDPAFLIWEGEKLIAGPIREQEANSMLKELKSASSKTVKKSSPKKSTKKTTTKKVKKDGKKK